MSRKALIIGTPGTKGVKGYLAGVETDLIKYREFLMSPLGGAWRSGEIISLRNPSEVEVNNGISELQKSDYSFVLFSGHGYYSAGLSSTIACLPNDIEINSSLLKIGAKKHTLILDCCREISGQMRKAVMDAAMASLTESKNLDADACRRRFDQSLDSCPPGISVLNSCSLRETSGDEGGFGGLYCANLIQTAENWRKNTAFNFAKQCYILDVGEAHDKTVPIVQRESGNRQNPTIMKPKSGNGFPFAVAAK